MALCGAKRPRFLGPNVYSEAPDGGWGWVVAVAFFLVEVFTYGTIKSFGIFLQDLMMEFGETNSRVLWIVSICVFVMTFNGELRTVNTITLTKRKLEELKLEELSYHLGFLRVRRSSILRPDEPLRLPVRRHGWGIAHCHRNHRYQFHLIRQSNVPHLWLSGR